MTRIQAKNTKPELKIRSMLHAAGFRFRLHGKGLAGRPDLVLPRYRSVVFIHGCFSHGHHCHLFKWPRANAEFWRHKIEGNTQRDRKVMAELHASGWRTLIIWECSLKGRLRLSDTVLLETMAHWIASGSDDGEISSTLIVANMQSN